MVFTSAKGEIEPIQNLVFTFDKPLVNDSLAGAWDSTEYIRFTPAVKGRFRWEKPDQLIFSPAVPFMPATEYKAELQSDLLKHSAVKKIDHPSISFHTPELRIENIFGRWVAESAGSSRPVPEIDLFFNYDINVANLKDKLSVHLNGASVPFQFRTLAVGKKITIRLLNVQPADKELTAAIRIDKSLIAEGGTKAGKNDLAIEGNLSSPYNLTINEITTDHDGTRASIYVRTNQQVVVDDIASKISFNPAVKFNVSASDDGFVISSDGINPDKSYLLELKKGIRGNIGGLLREDHADQVAFGELEPALSFGNSKAVYLSAKGNELIELKITNIPKIRIIVSKIFESNLMAASRYGYYPVDNASDEEEYYEEETNSDYVLGDVVYEKEIETATLPKYGKSRLLKFNIEDRLADLKGIYHIKVRSASNYWVSDSRFISKTDIGLVAREGRTRMNVFANSIRTATGLDGVQLSVYGANNQLLGIGNTNKDGFAEIRYERDAVGGFKPAMVIAKTPDDFTYLPLNSTGVNMSRFEVGGKIANASGLDAFVYEERDIYRPGETIHYSVIVRDSKWNVPGTLPVIFKFLLPNGKEFSLTRKSLNDQGAAEGTIALPVSAITGTYTLEVYSGTMVLLGSHTYSVEEFVPDRLRLATTSSTKRLRAGETMTMSVHADNFFGPPAASRKFESETQLRKVAFRPKGFDNYTFDLEAAAVSFDKKVTEGTTNETGDASVTFSAPAFYKNMGIIEAKTFFTVFDETGRPVSKSITTPIVTQDFFIGIGNDGYGYFPLNQQVRFPLIAVNYENKILQNVPARIQVVKYEYRTVLAKSGSYFRYESQEEQKIVAEQVIQINQQSTQFSFVPRTPGEYEIRASMNDGTSYVSRHFYSYGSWGDNNSFEVNTEGQVDIEADKNSYAAGEKAKLLFKTPFNGQLLVTTEQDELRSYHYLEVRNRSASMELPLTDEHLPNVFVTATLIKPHQLSEIPLTVAHGFKNLVVAKKDRKIPVEIIANKSSRSKTRQSISVKSTPGAFVTLAVVDNGVLQVTDFKTPDPYKYFYSSRALGVKSYDVYPLLFPELRATLSSTGGDGETDMNKRTNPMPAQRVKIASYWSGLQQAGSSGVATFNVDVPAFSGELRLMAVAFKNAAFGSAESTMKVADPLVISMAAPRFMSPGDTVDLHVSLTNTTSTTLTSVSSLQGTGPLSVAGSSVENSSTAAGRESLVSYKLVAGNSIGTGKILLNVKSGSEAFQESIDMSVRPAVGNQVRTGNGIISGTAQTSLTIPVSGLIPQGTSYQLVIGRSPVADLGSQFRYLMQYPFDCTEQVVSSAFPQLYLDDLSSAFRDGNKNSTNAAINEAIRIIRLRQIYNGGLTLWDNGSVHWWTSVYAAHFLVEARKAGYDIDNRLLSGLLEYINGRLKTRETIDYYYNRNEHRKIAPKEVAYSLYVLNLASRPNLPVMNYYKSNTNLLSLDSKYLLSASFALGGDKKAFQELLPASFSGEDAIAETGGSFYSDIRDEAIALDVLLSVDPQNKQIPLMAKRVAAKLQGRNWFSTQEASFSLLALDKFAKLNAGATVTAAINVNGKPIRKVTDKTLTLDAKELGGNNISISSQGEGRLYYSWQAEGVAADGSFKEEDNLIKVRRRFFDRYGNPITSNEFNQNDIVIVQVTVSKLLTGNIENVVATDILPAGFEIENPRTKEIPGMDWIKNASDPLSLDVRDDRINFFFDLNRSTQTYYYAVRAVTPGSFKLGPVSAEAMYNGEYHSYNGAGRIRVK